MNMEVLLDKMEKIINLFGFIIDNQHYRASSRENLILNGLPLFP